jgi:hypothetical protein
MKNPNYDKQVGKHPVPHAKGIAKDESADLENKKENDKENEKKD